MLIGPNAALCVERGVQIVLISDKFFTCLHELAVIIFLLLPFVLFMFAVNALKLFIGYHKGCLA